MLHRSFNVGRHLWRQWQTLIYATILSANKSANSYKELTV